MMRQRTPAEQDRVRPGKTIFTDVDRFGGLAAGREIDAVAEQLGTEPTNGGEGADAHPGRTINQMPAADAGVPFQNQLRAPVRLMSEMPALRAAGKTGDPVQLPDDGVGAEVK